MHSPNQPNPAFAIDVRGLDQFYGETPVLRGIDFRLDRGRTLALLGPSGCGKTTLLRLIAGLLPPTRGSIGIDGKAMADAATGAFVPPERRGLGMVFQDYALWPHMSVAENVGFPLEMLRIGKQERTRRVLAALARVSLEGLAGRRPSDLSGDQQQRVAIARAIVAEPRIVLFDEPLSNLDRELRESLVGEIARLVSSLGLTAVYVTHDHSEAFTLADEVAVMQGGEIAQLASPQKLVEAPASLAIAEFLKLGASADAIWQDGLWRLAGTGIVIPGPSDIPASRVMRVMFARKALRAAPPGEGTMDGTVTQAQFRGEGYALSIGLDGAGPPVSVQMMSEARYRAGDRIGLVVEPNGLRWFAAEESQQ
ncbi:MAG: ABC transporter ATP-binding protein [Mesorhizobium sp.]|uniref:ABC transporter ATP-binding protein n=1 Tax=Mesorhizobium sp. TaxID=1871066 RepID=UPI001AC1E0E8|nr:ABC transporter ATP-binding protein [Mesorhizobium sp.]MBN9216801.1 ABC transporter ATP-binding protein [Mesorhizobium sp.]